MNIYMNLYPEWPMIVYAYVPAVFLAIAIYLRLFGRSETLKDMSAACLWIGAILAGIMVLPIILSLSRYANPMALVARGLGIGVAVGVVLAPFLVFLDRVLDRLSAKAKAQHSEDALKIKVNSKPVGDNSFASSVNAVNRTTGLDTPPPAKGWNR